MKQIVSQEPVNETISVERLAGMPPHELKNKIVAFIEGCDCSEAGLSVDLLIRDSFRKGLYRFHCLNASFVSGNTRFSECDTIEAALRAAKKVNADGYVKGSFYLFNDMFELAQFIMDNEGD
jgi:hypothetical protein